MLYSTPKFEGDGQKYAEKPMAGTYLNKPHSFAVPGRELPSCHRESSMTGPLERTLRMDFYIVDPPAGEEAIYRTSQYKIGVRHRFRGSSIPIRAYALGIRVDDHIAACSNVLTAMSGVCARSVDCIAKAWT